MGMSIVFGLLGLFFGAVLAGVGGAVLGMLAGWLLGAMQTQSQRLTRLEHRLARLETGGRAQERQGASPATATDMAQAIAPVTGSATAAPHAPTAAASMTDVAGVQVVSSTTMDAVAADKVTTSTRPDTLPAAAGPTPASTTDAQRPAASVAGGVSSATSPSISLHENALWRWLTGGNPVAKAGIVVLFFGVAFLVRYAAARELVPLELRLAAVALGAMVMLGIGWRLRERSGPYGVSLQGGAVGILYLTVFAAARLYQLVPMPLMFALLVALVVLSAVLAVLQDALSLAAFGAAGGFLAPILASTGSGSHVALFSYYALLNLGILGIAWYRAWRPLNLLGFVFTFVLGTAWGYRYYRPEYFSTVEPFLILFFLFYVAIAVLYALRQPVRLRGYVDASLVFGVPLVGFALQAALVHDMVYGLAWSALALGVFYMLLAIGLWRRQGTGLRLLCEAFLALGVGFASLAIPLALDARWTAAAWSVEGAALVWLGLRQSRLLARSFGVLLQLGAGAGVALVWLTGVHAGHAWPVVSGDFLSGALLSLAGLLSAWLYYRHAAQLREWESLLHYVLLAWGLLWWFGSGMRELDRHLGGSDLFFATLVLLAATAAALTWLERRLNWHALAWPLCGVTPLALYLGAMAWLGQGLLHPFWHWGVFAWAAIVAVHFLLLRAHETNAEAKGVANAAAHWPEALQRLWHAAGLWWIIGLLTWEAAWQVAAALPGHSVWPGVVWGALPALLIIVLLRFGDRLAWPVMRFEIDYRVHGIAGMAVYLLGWVMAASVYAWPSPAPLPYVPLLNPVELTQALILVVLARWWVYAGRHPALWSNWLQPRYGWLALGLCAFLALNGVVAHTVHYWLAVPFTPYHLHHSVVFQSAISVLWTLVALVLTTLAARRVQRTVWFIGAAMLAVVVGKLFLVDLSGTGTVARIVSFIAVGVLMLLIGYLAPMPPRQSEKSS